jgi:hypothetical protein
MVRLNERILTEMERINVLARIHIQKNMEEAQTTKRRRLTASTVTARRQNLLEKEILFPYSTEERDNPSDMTSGH